MSPLQGIRLLALGLVDGEGRPAGLSQDGWDVRYLAWLPQQPVPLPARVEFEREDVRAKIVVNRWDLGSP